MQAFATKNSWWRAHIAKRRLLCEGLEPRLTPGAFFVDTLPEAQKPSKRFHETHEDTEAIRSDRRAPAVGKIPHESASDPPSFKVGGVSRWRGRASVSMPPVKDAGENLVTTQLQGDDSFRSSELFFSPLLLRLDALRPLQSDSPQDAEDPEMDARSLSADIPPNRNAGGTSAGGSAGGGSRGEPSAVEMETKQQPIVAPYANSAVGQPSIPPHGFSVSVSHNDAEAVGGRPAEAATGMTFANTNGSSEEAGESAPNAAIDRRDFDFNQDCFVDFADFRILATNFDPFRIDQKHFEGDANGDGRVFLDDFIGFRNDYAPNRPVCVHPCDLRQNDADKVLESIPMASGTAVFVDIADVSAALTFLAPKARGDAARTLGNATVNFSIAEPGYPIIDMLAEPTAFSLKSADTMEKRTPIDMQGVAFNLQDTPDGETQLRVLERVLPAGCYELQVEYELTDGTAEVAFSRDRVDAFFPLLDAKRLFRFGTDFIPISWANYTPSNLSYDLYGLELELAIEGVEPARALDGHQVMANGTVSAMPVIEGRSRAAWIVDFPRAHSMGFFAHLIPLSRYRLERLYLAPVAGNRRELVPVRDGENAPANTLEVVFYVESNRVNSGGRTIRYGFGFSPTQAFHDRIVNAFNDLEPRYGRYPHDRFLVRVGPDAFSGMEYRGATVSGPGAIEHEIAHQFFGVGTLDDLAANWINEGIALWIDGGRRIRSHEGPQDWANLCSDQRIIENSPYTRGIRKCSYEASPLAFESLAGFYADNGLSLDDVLAALFQEFRGETLSSQAFRTFLEDHTGLDHDWFFALVEGIGPGPSRIQADVRSVIFNGDLAAHSVDWETENLPVIEFGSEVDITVPWTPATDFVLRPVADQYRFVPESLSGPLDANQEFSASFEAFRVPWHNDRITPYGCEGQARDAERKRECDERHSSFRVITSRPWEPVNVTAILEAIGRFPDGILPDRSQDDELGRLGFLDVNNDGRVTMVDALLVDHERRAPLFETDYRRVLVWDPVTGRNNISITSSIILTGFLYNENGRLDESVHGEGTYKVINGGIRSFNRVTDSISDDEFDVMPSGRFATLVGTSRSRLPTRQDPTIYPPVRDDVTFEVLTPGFGFAQTISLLGDAPPPTQESIHVRTFEVPADSCRGPNRQFGGVIELNDAGEEVCRLQSGIRIICGDFNDDLQVNGQDNDILKANTGNVAGKTLADGNCNNATMVDVHIGGHVDVDVGHDDTVDFTAAVAHAVDRDADGVFEFDFDFDDDGVDEFAISNAHKLDVNGDERTDFAFVVTGESVVAYTVDENGRASVMLRDGTFEFSVDLGVRGSIRFDFDSNKDGLVDAAIDVGGDGTVDANGIVDRLDCAGLRANWIGELPDDICEL